MPDTNRPAYPACFALIAANRFPKNAAAPFRAVAVALNVRNELNGGVDVMEVLKAIKEYWGVIVGVVGFLFGWAKWSAGKNFVEKKDFDDLKDRVGTIENNISTLATKEEINRLLIQNERILGDLKETKAIVSRMERTVQRQEDYLMNNK